MKMINIFILMFLLGTSSLFSLEPLELVRKNLDARGGIENYSKLKTIRISGKVTSEKMEIPTVIYFKFPDKFKIYNSLNQQDGITAIVADSGWMVDPTRGINQASKIPVIEFLQVKALMLNIFDFVNYDFFRLISNPADSTLILYECNADSAFYVLKTIDKSGNSIDYHLHKKTFLDIKHEVKFFYLDKPMHIVFKDFFTLDGLTIPRVIESQVGDSRKTKMSIENIKINIDVDDEMFEMK